MSLIQQLIEDFEETSSNGDFLINLIKKLPKHRLNSIPKYIDALHDRKEAIINEEIELEYESILKSLNIDKEDYIKDYSILKKDDEIIWFYIDDYCKRMVYKTSIIRFVKTYDSPRNLMLNEMRPLNLPNTKFLRHHITDNYEDLYPNLNHDSQYRIGLKIYKIPLDNN